MKKIWQRAEKKYPDRGKKQAAADWRCVSSGTHLRPINIFAKKDYPPQIRQAPWMCRFLLLCVSLVPDLAANPLCQLAQTFLKVAPWWLHCIEMSHLQIKDSANSVDQGICIGI